MSTAVPMIIAVMLIHEITLIALVDFFALKYRQANKKCKKVCLKFKFKMTVFNCLPCFHRPASDLFLLFHQKAFPF